LFPSVESDAGIANWNLIGTCKELFNGLRYMIRRFIQFIITLDVDKRRIGRGERRKSPIADTLTSLVKSSRGMPKSEGMWGISG
jgi:hypothetical protein